jgi:uncharacterized protein
LARYPHRIIACSGGVDSLLLADIASAEGPDTTIVAHSVSPAVPGAASERVATVAADLGWRLEVVVSAEFDDPRYLDNPVNRCYFCKTNLYDELDRLVATVPAGGDWVLMSGANVDDLGEYRPGLDAAREHDVRHPYVEAGLSKRDIRALAQAGGRDWHDLPASPCLSSRVYTGTQVTPGRLRSIERGEDVLRSRTGIRVARCRVRGSDVLVEVSDEDRHLIDDSVLAEVTVEMRKYTPGLGPARLDDSAYAPGRAFVGLGVPTVRG